MTPMRHTYEDTVVPNASSYVCVSHNLLITHLRCECPYVTSGHYYALGLDWTDRHTVLNPVISPERRVARYTLTL